MITPDELAARVIPFDSLRASTEAFIDYCLPQSTPKFNYALIGPGVSQNPDQPVNLREPHGFQVGGVSMPHGKTNPPHLHFTCEVFICTRGRWRVEWGFNPEARHAEIGDGDIASIPTWVYRGFTNVGVDDGFLFTALGRDRTGGVLWGPTTIAAAQSHGVYLTRDHRMVDLNRGQARPADGDLFQPMTAAEIGALRDWTPEQMARRIVRFAELQWSRHGLLDSALPGGGAQLAPVVGLGIAEDRDLAVPVPHAHGLSIEWLRIPPGGGVSRHRLAEKQVLIVRRGHLALQVETTEGPVTTVVRGSDSGWDTVSVPPGEWRRLHNPTDAELLVLVMTAGDHRKTITWCDTVRARAAAAGWTHDADGFVALSRFVERAQG